MSIFNINQALNEALDSPPFPITKNPKSTVSRQVYMFSQDDKKKESYSIEFKKDKTLGDKVFTIELGQAAGGVSTLYFKKILTKFANPQRIIVTIIEAIRLFLDENKSKVEGLALKLTDKAFGIYLNLVKRIIQRKMQQEVTVFDETGLAITDTEDPKEVFKYILFSPKMYGSKGVNKIFSGSAVKLVDAPVKAVVATPPELTKPPEPVITQTPKVDSVPEPAKKADVFSPVTTVVKKAEAGDETTLTFAGGNGAKTYFKDSSGNTIKYFKDPITNDELVQITKQNKLAWDTSNFSSMIALTYNKRIIIPYDMTDNMGENDSFKCVFFSSSYPLMHLAKDTPTKGKMKEYLIYNTSHLYLKKTYQNSLCKVYEVVVKKIPQYILTKLGIEAETSKSEPVKAGQGDNVYTLDSSDIHGKDSQGTAFVGVKLNADPKFVYGTLSQIITSNNAYRQKGIISYFKPLLLLDPDNSVGAMMVLTSMSADGKQLTYVNCIDFPLDGESPHIIFDTKENTYNTEDFIAQYSKNAIYLTKKFWPQSTDETATYNPPEFKSDGVAPKPVEVKPVETKPTVVDQTYIYDGVKFEVGTEMASINNSLYQANKSAIMNKDASALVWVYIKGSAWLYVNATTKYADCNIIFDGAVIWNKIVAGAASKIDFNTIEFVNSKVINKVTYKGDKVADQKAYLSELDIDSIINHNRDQVNSNKADFKFIISNSGIVCLPIRSVDSTSFLYISIDSIDKFMGETSWSKVATAKSTSNRVQSSYSGYYEYVYTPNATKAPVNSTNTISGNSTSTSSVSGKFNGMDLADTVSYPDEVRSWMTSNPPASIDPTIHKPMFGSEFKELHKSPIKINGVLSIDLSKYKDNFVAYIKDYENNFGNTSKFFTHTVTAMSSHSKKIFNAVGKENNLKYGDIGLPELSAYTGSMYSDINGVLRGKSNGVSNLKDYVKKIDKLYETHGVTLDESITVFRGQRTRQNVIQNVLNGNPYIMRGFTSCSFGISTAISFAKTDSVDVIKGSTADSPNSYLVVFVISGLNKCLSITPHEQSAYTSEQEVILNRGTVMQYDSTLGYYKKGHVYVIPMTIVSQTNPVLHENRKKSLTEIRQLIKMNESFANKGKNMSISTDNTDKINQVELAKFANELFDNFKIEDLPEDLQDAIKNDKSLNRFTDEA